MNLNLLSKNHLWKPRVSPCTSQLAILSRHSSFYKELPLSGLSVSLSRAASDINNNCLGSVNFWVWDTHSTSKELHHQLLFSSFWPSAPSQERVDLLHSPRPKPGLSQSVWRWMGSRGERRGEEHFLWWVGLFRMPSLKPECLNANFQEQARSRIGRVKIKDLKLTWKKFGSHIFKNFLCFYKNGYGLLDNFYT